MSRHQYQITYKGRVLLVDAEVYDSDPSVGIFGYWSDEHTLLDPDTELPRPDWEKEMTDEDWSAIADKFDEIANHDIPIELANMEMDEAFGH